MRDGGNTFTPKHYRLELNSAHPVSGSQHSREPHTQFGVFFLEISDSRAGRGIPKMPVD